MDFGVYIHYPWCRSRCSYCDFAIAVAPLSRIPHRRYLDAVLAELAARAPDYANRRLRSIYVGGGTPSLWPAEHLAHLLDRVKDAFGGDPEEVTIEANPTDCDSANLGAWLDAGVTRLSIGAQSTDPGELVRLGRDHAMGDGLAAVEASLGAAFDSISVDVMLAVPGGAGGMASVDAMVAKGVPHVSVYELTFEPRTTLGRAAARGEVLPLAQELRAELYVEAHERLTAAGYEHYEISSYALPGHRAVHNSLYWKCAEYLGLGSGAASFRQIGAGAERITNPRSVGRYLRGGAPEVESLTAADVETDRIWLGMRTADGVEASVLSGRAELVSRLAKAGLVERKGGRIRPTLCGFLLNDAVARSVVGG